MSSTLQGTLAPPVTTDDHRIGPESAPVTLVEYGDYECPHCRHAHGIIREVLRQREGQVRFAYRHFPLTQTHPHAEQAAEAAEAAAAQGAFWPMHDQLFAHQGQLDEASLIALAAAAGVDSDQVKRDLIEGTYADYVRADFLSGVRSGVNGTPTFFINGRRHDDAWEVEDLLAAIDQAL